MTTMQSQQPLGPNSRENSPKSKALATGLAAFFGPWTWLYTYKRDGKKLWIGLAGGTAALGCVIGGFAGLLAVAFIGGYGGDADAGGVFVALGLGLGVIGFFGIWVWALVDAGSKPERWYRDY